MFAMESPKELNVFFSSHGLRCRTCEPAENILRFFAVPLQCAESQLSTLPWHKVNVLMALPHRSSPKILLYSVDTTPLRLTWKGPCRVGCAERSYAGKGHIAPLWANVKTYGPRQTWSYIAYRASWAPARLFCRSAAEDFLEGGGGESLTLLHPGGCE